MRRFSLFLLLPLFILTACTASLPPPADDGLDASSSSLSSSSAPSADIRTEEVDYGAATGYLAMPSGSGSFPALILIHEWWGLNDNIRGFAEEFARQGYVALAVDLYEGQATEDAGEAQRLAGSVRDNVDDAFANLRDAVSYVRARPEVNDDRLASVGWCFGGGWSYQMARNDLGVRASVMYYGRFAPEDDLSQMKAEIIGHFGEEDESIPVDDVRAFQAKLETLSGDHQIYIYPNEGHGFAKELQSPSARQAWDRTLSFLRGNL